MVLGITSLTVQAFRPLRGATTESAGDSAEAASAMGYASS